jgi:hypothetical protein
MRLAPILLCIVATGCPPMGGGAYVPPPATTQPAPTTDNRVSGQVFIDNIVTYGYQCKDWSCWNPQPSRDKFSLANWQVIVAYDSTSNGPVWPVYLKSVATRAFGQQCAAFDRYLKDLTDPPNNFVVTCDDDSQQFIFMTTVNLQAGMAVDLSRQWLDQHVVNRINAFKLLDSVHAIRPSV